MRHNMEYIDDYILYTESMAEYLHITDKKWMVMEGSINSREIERPLKTSSSSKNKFIVMYSGGIKKNFKIENLL